MEKPKKEDFGWVEPRGYEDEADQFSHGWCDEHGEEEYDKALRDWENRDRRTGRTTRLIDEAIQELFTTGSCVAFDHNDSDEARKYLLNRIINRLHNKHFSCSTNLFNENVRVNMNTPSIKLNDYEKRS